MAKCDYREVQTANGPAVEVKLTKGLTAIIDPADLPLVADKRWKAKIYPRGAYAAHTYQTNGRTHHLAMHRLILGPACEGRDVDHINHNTLDNRRANLRVATRMQNRQHSRKRGGCTSNYKGVYWRKREQKWYAKLTIQKRTVYIGLFASEEDAARAYDARARQAFGEFAHLNFA